MLPYARGITFSCKVIDLDNPPRSRAVASESEASRSDRKLHGLCSASSGRPLRDAFGPQPRQPGRLARVAAEGADPWSHARRVGPAGTRHVSWCRGYPNSARPRRRSGSTCACPRMSGIQLQMSEDTCSVTVSGAEVPVLSVASLNAGVLPPAIPRKGWSGRRHSYRGRGPRSDFRRRSQQHPGQFNPRGLDPRAPGPDIHP